MFTVAGIQRTSRRSKPPLQFVDDLQHGLAGAGVENALDDQQTGHGARAGGRQSEHRMMLLVKLGERHPCQVLRFADQLAEGETAQRGTKPLVLRLLGRDAEVPTTSIDFPTLSEQRIGILNSQCLLL